MVKISAIFVVCATLVFSAVALANSTPQQNCDSARIIAWQAYTSCVERVVARLAKDAGVSPYAAFANCRHAYFQKWTGFQSPHHSLSLGGSTCIGSRFTDNGDGTATDHLSGLLWEKKTNLDGTSNTADPHDADNTYSWFSAFTSFLVSLNGTGFAGQYDWRVPAMVELQTILLDFPCSGDRPGPHCTCSSSPCVDSALDPANTAANFYWSDTTDITDIGRSWILSDGFVFQQDKGIQSSVRAVRGGL